MALVPGQPFAGYEIIAELGRGGMGAVYQARQLSLQRIVALKILRPHLADDKDFLTRFQSEAIAAAKLNHPNIVQVFEAGEENGIDYIVMEYVEGETIHHRLRRCGRLPLTEALDIAYHVATALDYAWQTAQLVHRDVKPENIFLAHHGTVKLGDFGIAKILAEGSASQTATGFIMGSPHFISPEQVRGQRDVDYRADIYSLGCTLHYMMTGRTVFEGPDLMSIMYKHVNDEPQSIRTLLPNCPAGVNRLLTRMMAKDRDQRHASHAALIEQIVSARAEAAIWEQSDERQRRRMAMADEPVPASRRTYALAILLALAMAAWLVYERQFERSSRVERTITLSDPSDRRDFVRSLEKFPPAERVERVMAMMQELNPGFAGREKYMVEDDFVTELSFSSIGVRNLWPLSALQHLRVLRCGGDATNRIRGSLFDLTPLAGLPLEELDCSWTNVEDLRPLSNLKLRVLRCANTHVQNLAALRGLPLTELDVTSSGVSDLSPLKGMALTSVRCDGTKVRDLSPLHDMPVKSAAIDLRLIRSQADTIRSWTRLEGLNDLSQREIARRLGNR